MFVTKLGQYPIVVGITWLGLPDIAVQFASNTVTFGSQYCITNSHDALVTVQVFTEDTPQPVHQG